MRQARITAIVSVVVFYLWIIWWALLNLCYIPAVLADQPKSVPFYCDLLSYLPLSLLDLIIFLTNNVFIFIGSIAFIAGLFPLVYYARRKQICWICLSMYIPVLLLVSYLYVLYLLE